MGPTFNKIKKNKNIKSVFRQRDGRRSNFYFLYFYFFSLASLFDIRKSDRPNSSGEEAKCSTQRGLRVGTKNTGFHRVFN